MKKSPEFIQQANTRMRDAVQQCLPLFESMKLRSDSFDEYWHTVFHRDSESGEVKLRSVQRHSLASKQRNSAKRAHALIKTEIGKSTCRITDRTEAKRLLDILSDSVTFAGFKI